MRLEIASVSPSRQASSTCGTKLKLVHSSLLLPPGRTSLQAGLRLIGSPDVAWTKGTPLEHWNGAQSKEAGQGDLRKRRLPPQEINRTSPSMFLRTAAGADRQPGA
jgi:hypothetical protein